MKENKADYLTLLVRRARCPGGGRRAIEHENGNAPAFGGLTRRARAGLSGLSHTDTTVRSVNTDTTPHSSFHLLCVDTCVS